MSKKFEVDISLEANFHGILEASNEDEAYDMIYEEVKKILEEKKVKKDFNLECDFYETTWSNVKESEEQ